MKRDSYSYSTLRHVHDIATQEFFVVGVAVYSPNSRFLRFRLRRNLGLAGEILNKQRLANFRAVMRHAVQRGIEIEKAYQSNVLEASFQSSLAGYLLEFFPKDDSALQWGPIQNGLSSNLDETTDRLYQRYCGKYDRERQKNRVTDKEAWQDFHNKLVDRRLDRYFSKKSIQGKVDEVKFPFAWKNSIWHCIETISFDLSDADAIRNKAHRHVGEIAAIRDAAEEFAVYYVTTPPADTDLNNAFEKAVRLLEGAPHKNVNVVSVGGEEALLDRFTQQIIEHHDIEPPGGSSFRPSS